MKKHKPSARQTQVAAVPLRRGPNGTHEVLLLTSRETRRWIVPKGWPMKGVKAHKAAAIEAREEAGLVGRMSKAPLGAYESWKRIRSDFYRVTVKVFRLDVERQLVTWREKGQRSMIWTPLQDAALLVDEPGLAALLEVFATQLAIADNGTPPAHP